MFWFSKKFDCTLLWHGFFLWIFAKKIAPLEISRALLADFNANHYEGWPNFDWLGEWVFWKLAKQIAFAIFAKSVETYGQLWEHVPTRIQTMVVLFDAGSESLVGIQLLLDLSKYADRLMARRFGRQFASIKHFLPFAAAPATHWQTPFTSRTFQVLLFSDAVNVPRCLWPSK